MTKKDYIKIAELLRGHREKEKIDIFYDDVESDEDSMFEELVLSFCQLFTDENAEFNEDMFKKVIYKEKSEGTR